MLQSKQHDDGSAEYKSLYVTMILGGLIYCILSIAYLHSTFPTRNESKSIEDRISRYEHRMDLKLNEINKKLDHLMQRGQ